METNTTIVRVEVVDDEIRGYNSDGAYIVLDGVCPSIVMVSARIDHNGTINRTDAHYDIVREDESYHDAIQRVARQHYGTFNCNDENRVVNTRSYVRWTNYIGTGTLHVVGKIDTDI